MSKTARIIIAAHKPYRMPEDELYLPVHVGAAEKESIGFQRDDEGENISALNPNFCELTGLYWAWKNINTDYIGLVHYRRYFAIHRTADRWQSILKYEEIKKDLGIVVLFLPKKRRYWIETLYSHYEHTHDIRQLDETRKIISQKNPEYLNAFDRTVRQRWGYMFNMMIMERHLLDEYCNWLFPILFELRRRIGEEGLTSFDNRYCGRISEIIFNVWLNEKKETGDLIKDRIREIPYIQMEKSRWGKKILAFLKAKIFRVKYNSSF